MRAEVLIGLATVALSITHSAAQVHGIGYATVSASTGWTLLANPVSAGVTNGANEIMPIIDGERILTWSGTGFDQVSYDAAYGGWIDADKHAACPPSLPPGKGFFFFNPGPVTNLTFVGEILPAPQSTNFVDLPPGYSLVSSIVPGFATNITFTPISLPVIDGMQILTWNGTGYVYSAFDRAFGGWIDSEFRPIAAPSYRLGEAFFFFNPGPGARWEQSSP